ncbi:MAG: hypothetical protein Q7R95_01785, partial [bacterium]|nr:hypothetical protein [bacterium]
TTTKQCECDSGWSRNINGSCLIDDSNTTTNKLLASIDESLKDDANASGDTIQDDTLSKGFFDFGEHAYDNIRSQFDSVNSLVDGGFTNNLPTSNISTCAFSRDFSFLDSTIPIEFDVCKVISPVYPVLYFVFYILFFSTFLSFVFSILIRTDGR